jgi:serine/threonine protein kinase
MRGGDLVCDFDAKILEQIDKSVGKEGILGEGAFGKAFVVLEKIDTETDIQSLVEIEKTKYVVKELKISELETKKTELESKKTKLESKKSNTQQQKIVNVEQLIQKITDQIKEITDQIENQYNYAKKEAEILKQLSTEPQHPNILKYIGCSDTENKKQFYIITEYNEGYISLFDYINKSISHNKDAFKLTEENTKDVNTIVYDNIIMQTTIMNKCITQLYEGLYEIHSRGVFHRDIKPENIIIDPKTGNIKYIDFGVSSTTDDISITFVGTIHYMPYFGDLHIDGSVDNILQIFTDNDINPTYQLIYIDYWGLAFVIYMIIFVQSEIIKFSTSISNDLSDERRWLMNDNGSLVDLHGNHIDLDVDTRSISSNTSLLPRYSIHSEYYRKLLFKFYNKDAHEYFPEIMRDDFTTINLRLDSLNIPHYIPVSAILYTIGGKYTDNNLIAMVNHFIIQYEHMKKPK